MKILLAHNPGAGDGEHSWQAFRRVLRDHGHKVEHLCVKTENLKQGLAKKPDLVIAAGGDGTVRKAALALAGHGVPLAILPVGTANNIACSLGVLDHDEYGFLARIETGREAALDLGSLRSKGRKGRFVEGFGAGLIADFIARMERQFPDEPPSESAMFGLFHEMAEFYPRRRYRMLIDEREISGEFLFVEMMNIRSLGPSLSINGGSRTDDGSMECITAGPGDRDAILDCLARRRRGIQQELALPKTSFRELKIHVPQAAHVDDEVMEDFQGMTVHIVVKPHAVKLWLPPKHARLEPDASGIPLI